MWNKTKLRDFFIHFDATNPNHTAAVDLLQQHADSVMNDNSDWVKVYRGQNTQNFLEEAAKIIKEFEGFRANPYLCPAGVWTIGYGSTYYPNGKLVEPGDKPVSREEAEKYLIDHLHKAVIPTLARTIPTWGVMNGNQKAAICSFAYNLGSHFYGYKNFTTITRALSSKSNWGQVPQALQLYVNPGSEFEAGLKRRRRAEADLWGKGG
jgi:GH24 family phage-related lysozyme (muramidase)